MTPESTSNQDIIPFLTPAIQQQVVEQLVGMPEDGVITAWDPATCTAVYILARVNHEGLAHPVRWTIEGPVTREHAQQTGRQISEITSEQPGEFSGSVSIN